MTSSPYIAYFGVISDILQPDRGFSLCFTTQHLVNVQQKGTCVGQQYTVFMLTIGDVSHPGVLLVGGLCFP